VRCADTVNWSALFCQDDFVCDLPNNRCLQGPQALQKLSAAQEAARQQNLKYNRYFASAAQQSDSQLLGYDMGSTYYIWDGDPREMPTPRYQQGSGIPSSGASRPMISSAPARRYTIRPSAKNQLLALLAAARSFAPNDPNRAGAVKLLRNFVRDDKIPVDVDALLDCDKPEAAAPGQFKIVQLQNQPSDIDNAIDDAIKNNELCAELKPPTNSRRVKNTSSASSF
jgi:hypothetical protein